MSPIAAHSRANDAPQLRSRLAWMAACAVFFQVLYGSCAWQAARLGTVATLATRWDEGLPYVPQMLLPYMSSGPILAAAFLWVPTRAGLEALVQRLALSTALAALVFTAWPHRFAWARPAGVGPAWTDALARGLDQLDGRFNQFPSLHVAYAVLVAPALLAALEGWRPGWGRRLAQAGLLVWLAAMAASTVLAWQHHLADVAGGLLLAGMVCVATPVRSGRAKVAFAHGTLALGALALSIAALPSVAAAAAAAWCAACCASVSRAYAVDDAAFLGKRDGRFPAASQLLHAPYLLGYRMTWVLVWLRARWRGRAAIVQVADGLWAGRRLAASEIALLPPDAAVIDLAAELPQLPALRGRPGAAFALLDIVPPRADQVQAIRAAIGHWHAGGRPVLVHCAMGYRRSHAAVEDFLAATAPPARPAIPPSA